MNDVHVSRFLTNNGNNIFFHHKLTTITCSQISAGTGISFIFSFSLQMLRQAPHVSFSVPKNTKPIEVAIKLDVHFPHATSGQAKYMLTVKQQVEDSWEKIQAMLGVDLPIYWRSCRDGIAPNLFCSCCSVQLV